MAVILVSNGLEALVDDEDFDALSRHKWHVYNNGYVNRNARRDGRRVKISMHRQIMGMSHDDKRWVDHINGIPWDNRKENLRFCSREENVRNSKRQVCNTTGYKGVTAKRGKFRARISYNRKRIFLGDFPTPELAHEMYCLAADMLHGEFANHG